MNRHFLFFNIFRNSTGNRQPVLPPYYEFVSYIGRKWINQRTITRDRQWASSPPSIRRDGSCVREVPARKLSSNREPQYCTWYKKNQDSVATLLSAAQSEHQKLLYAYMYTNLSNQVTIFLFILLNVHRYILYFSILILVTSRDDKKEIKSHQKGKKAKREMYAETHASRYQNVRSSNSVCQTLILPLGDYLYMDDQANSTDHKIREKAKPGMSSESGERAPRM